MASANHSEQKGQDWGEEREGTRSLPQGVDPSPRVGTCSLLPHPAEVMAGLGCRKQEGAESRQVRSHAH